MLILYLYVKVTAAEDNLIEKLESVYEAHSLAIAHPLWTLDDEGLGRSLETIVLHSEITCVEVFEEDFKERYQWPVNCVESSDKNKLMSKELFYDEHPVGKINLHYTGLPQREALTRDVLNGAVFFFLLVSVAGLVGYAALQYTVGRPLSRLMTSIKKAEQDNYLETVSWSSDDELGNVISAYNNMINQIDDNTRELVAARQQAETATYIKSRFLANMSHELRTPLNAVIGITEMLREEAEEQDIDTEPYDRVAMSGRHLLHLIDDILDFSKIEAGKVNISKEKIELAELLEGVCSTVQPMAHNGNNSLTLNYSGSPATIVSDPFRLRQILINLLSNACKFTKDGNITLEVFENQIMDKGGVCFSVRDTGIGISKEQRERLFSDFSQADISTTREYGGTGLGLAISQRLCQLLGGEISLESTVGVGSEFSFSLLSGIQQENIRESSENPTELPVQYHPA